MIRQKIAQIVYGKAVSARLARAFADKDKNKISECWRAIDGDLAAARRLAAEMGPVPVPGLVKIKRRGVVVADMHVSAFGVTTDRVVVLDVDELVKKIVDVIDRVTDQETGRVQVYSITRKTAKERREHAYREIRDIVRSHSLKREG